MPTEPPDPEPVSPGFGRRRFFLVGAVAAAGLGTGLGLLSEGDGRPVNRHGAAAPGTAAARARYLQIVAHEDDDLLFMTPDLSESLRAGSPHLTVYLSAGESKAGVPPDTHDVNAYVADRETGVRTAYALMLGVRDRWRRETLTVGALRLLSYTLADRPDIRLVFLLVPDGRDPRASLGWHTLGRLWSATGHADVCGWTQAPEGSPYRRCLSREDVLTALTGLIQSFRPTVVRSQDTAPDERYSADHPDHIAAAHFAAEAVRRHAARHPEQPLLQVNYRDYNIRNLAVNLADADNRYKRRVFAAYSAHDYRISAENPHWDAYEARMVYRWPRGTGFTAADAVYAVGAGRLLVWRRAGGRWSAPRSLGDPGGPLAPAVAAAGPVVLGLRTDTGEVVAYDRRGWRSLGRPDPKKVRNQAGTPVAVADGSGTVAAFVRNGRGGVSARFLGPGGWSPRWTDLPGVDLNQVVSPQQKKRHHRYGDVQDGLSAVVTDDGLIELFAATRSQILWWRQRAPGRPLVFAGPLPVAGAIAPLAAEAVGGRVEVMFREPWTGRTLAISRLMTSNVWDATVPVRAAAHLDGEAPVVGVLPPTRLIGVPAPLPDGTQVCAIGADGRLHVAPGSAVRKAAWRAIGR
ncbi:PIG-L family deacetylase [Actinoallomurus soli]|uniref:PIG-L family deacetylase n=1 Tax=Actinoallomurus soli TaxID=2952535 RepID=UPI0020923976|nr:PIG-L family deacetylase [Actinoallomurus soli]MCO5975001.1 PIG-L family deacetylase [Actinoallomurus soli]